VSISRFNRAIVREPGRSVVDGLRFEDRGAPSYESVREEHSAYTEALRSAGVDVTMLPPLEAFPDSMFVEDPALVFSEGAILLRPGAPTRIGEADELAPAIRNHFELVIELPLGFADGGDVLVTPDLVMIGLSERTDRAGAEQLAASLLQLGRESRIVVTPDDVLHLKSACSLLDDETMLCTPSLAETGIFDSFRCIITADGESGSANALRVNDVLFVDTTGVKTNDQLDRLGYQLVPLETSEISKIDAGLSCMSLRWFDLASG